MSIKVFDLVLVIIVSVTVVIVTVVIVTVVIVTVVIVTVVIVTVVIVNILTTEEIFEGQRFALLTMFFSRFYVFSCPEQL